MADSIKPGGASSIDRLENLITTLRGENGCPWDKKQTPVSMARYLIEEVYELADAIISKDADAVCEEAGDVLFQLLFVIHLYRESGQFGLGKVVEQTVTKMVRRHPHVFGDATAKTPETVRENWENIKRQEKNHRDGRSVFSSIPQNLPALLRAAMVSERAAKSGFDWEDISGVMTKTMEEWMEFKTAVEDPDASVGSERAALEFGDILFTMVNVARFARIHPETALMRSIQKFENRFAYMEKKAMEGGQPIENLTLPEMHLLWDEAKARIG